MTNRQPRYMSASERRAWDRKQAEAPVADLYVDRNGQMTPATEQGARMVSNAFRGIAESLSGFGASRPPSHWTQQAREQKTEELERTIQRAAQALLRVEATPDPSEYPDGTVLSWEAVFPTGETVYTYVALKTLGRWYTTARSGNVLTDAELFNKLARQEVKAIWAVTAWERIDASQKPSIATPGATEEAGQPEPKAKKLSHAECSHPMTPYERRKCREARRSSK